MVQKSSQPVDMVDYPLFTRFYHHPRWLFGISEPSIVFCLTFWSSKLRLRSCVWKTQVWCVKKIRRYQHELIHLRFSISSRWWCPRCWLWHDDRHILTFLTDLSLMVDGNPANHLLYIYMKPDQQWDIHNINWCKISSINSMDWFQIIFGETCGSLRNLTCGLFDASDGRWLYARVW